jgi:UDP-N-acetylmuramate-alanine ligase
MAEGFETQFITTADKPALIAFSTPDWLDTVKAALNELGYKVHAAVTNSLNENESVKALQNMSMSDRRHATVILLGNSFQTFAPMEAFQQSVHAVINASEIFMLKQLIEKAVAENALFLQSYREIQRRVASL